MRTAQVNFSKGEISPHLYGRFDVDAYHAGLKTAKNVVVLKYGGVTKRPGTRLVARAHDDSKPTRGLSFQFSLEQAYVLEFGHGYMRALAMGGVVLEDALTISNITLAATAQVTAAYHGFAAGDQVYLSGITGPVDLNNRFWNVVSVIDADNFTIDADTTGMPAFASDSGGVTRTEAPPAPPAPPAIYVPQAPPVGPWLGGWDWNYSWL